MYSDPKSLERIFTSVHQAPIRIKNFVLKLQPYNFTVKFVCVEVLRPSQPNGVMSSAVSLPNHTFTGQA